MLSTRILHFLLAHLYNLQLVPIYATYRVVVGNKHSTDAAAQQCFDTMDSLLAWLVVASLATHYCYDYDYVHDVAIMVTTTAWHVSVS